LTDPDGGASTEAAAVYASGGIQLISASGSAGNAATVYEGDAEFVGTQANKLKREAQGGDLLAVQGGGVESLAKSARIRDAQQKSYEGIVARQAATKHNASRSALRGIITVGVGIAVGSLTGGLGSGAGAGAASALGLSGTSGAVVGGVVAGGVTGTISGAAGDAGGELAAQLAYDGHVNADKIVSAAKQGAVTGAAGGALFGGLGALSSSSKVGRAISEISPAAGVEIETSTLSVVGNRVKIQGLNATEISGRLSSKQLAALQAEHGTEFAQIYLTGPGRNGGGGTYYLIQGGEEAVNIPIAPNVRLINHTHPLSVNGKAVALTASSGDQAVLRALKKAGSPQKISQVVPEVGEPFRFSATHTHGID
jgi:hypothetical protein